MPESKSHKQAKSKAAGRTGRTEVAIRGKRRLDAATPMRATEIERSGRERQLVRAAQRLRDSNKPQKVLVVPQKHMAAAGKAMRRVGVAGTVKNLSGTRASYVGARSGRLAPRHHTSSRGGRSQRK